MLLLTEKYTVLSQRQRREGAIFQIPSRKYLGIHHHMLTMMFTSRPEQNQMESATIHI